MLRTFFVSPRKKILQHRKCNQTFAVRNVIAHLLGKKSNSEFDWIEMVLLFGRWRTCVMTYIFDQVEIFYRINSINQSSICYWWLWENTNASFRLMCGNWANIQREEVYIQLHLTDLLLRLHFFPIEPLQMAKGQS